MPAIQAGVVMRCKFLVPSSKVFSGYVDYIDRDEAIRNENTSKYNGFQHYMGNPEKSTGLFTADLDYVNPEKAEELKKIFDAAQDRGSLMWQIVISFDNRWLQENGLYDPETKVLSEPKIRAAAREAMKTLQEKESLQDGVWSASIHFNTDNIHVHAAMVEPVPSRQIIETGRYKGQYRGKIANKTIAACKSKVVNSLSHLPEQNLAINSLIRDTLVNGLRSVKMADFTTDPVLMQEFMQLEQDIAKSVPFLDKRGYSYASNHMAPFRERLDALSEKFMMTYYPNEYRDCMDLIKKNAEMYQKSYGLRSEQTIGREENKRQDLFKRMGNVLISEMRMMRMQRKADGRPDNAGSVARAPATRSYSNILFRLLATVSDEKNRLLSQYRNEEEIARKKAEYEREQEGLDY